MSTARVPLEEPAGAGTALAPPPAPSDDMDWEMLGVLLALLSTDRVVDAVGLGDGRVHAALEVDPAGAVEPAGQFEHVEAPDEENVPTEQVWQEEE